MPPVVTSSIAYVTLYTPVWSSRIWSKPFICSHVTCFCTCGYSPEPRIAASDLQTGADPSMRIPIWFGVCVVCAARFTHLTLSHAGALQCEQPACCVSRNEEKTDSKESPRKMVSPSVEARSMKWRSAAPEMVRGGMGGGWVHGHVIGAIGCARARRGELHPECFPRKLRSDRCQSRSRYTWLC